MSYQNNLQKAPKFTEFNELSSIRNGGQILFATDDWFAEAECMLSEEAPVFKPDVYTEYGKWMDGWETRRKRCAGHDWCIIKLAVPGIIHGIDVDTSFFTGNYAPRYSIQGAYLSDKELITDESLIPLRNNNSIGTGCTKEAQEKIQKLHSDTWKEIVPMKKLNPGYHDTCHNYQQITTNEIWTHLRLNIYPDGGIARLHVYGEAKSVTEIDKYETIDLVAMKNGGVCEGFSNAHFGHPRNIIRPGTGINMADGWETARRLDRPPILETDEHGVLQMPGDEWAIFRLGHVGIVSSFIVDTKHFKGNYPDSVQIEGTLLKPTRKWNNRTITLTEWRCILPRSKLSPNRVHEFLKDDLQTKGPFSHIRITIVPDGGVSRLRIFGTVHATMYA